MRALNGSSLGAALRRGFTMVELMVVVGIIGLVTATVTLSIEAVLPGERLNSSVRGLAATLMDVRSQAIGYSMEYRVIYDLEEHRYRMATPFRVGGGGGRLVTERDEEYDTDERYYTPWQNLEDGVEFSHVFIAGEIYTSGQVFVMFDPLGTASDHSVVLTQPKYESMFTIEVLALTGLIRMHQGEYLREEPRDGDFD